MTERTPEQQQEFEEYLDRVTGTVSTDFERRYERALSDLLVTGKVTIGDLDITLDYGTPE